MEKVRVIQYFVATEKYVGFYYLDDRIVSQVHGKVKMLC